MKDYPAFKELNRYAFIHELYGKPRIKCGRLNNCDFICGAMSRDNLLIHWTVISTAYDVVLTLKV